MSKGFGMIEGVEAGIMSSTLPLTNASTTLVSEFSETRIWEGNRMEWIGRVLLCLVKQMRGEKESSAIDRSTYLQKDKSPLVSLGEQSPPANLDDWFFNRSSSRSYGFEPWYVVNYKPPIANIWNPARATSSQ